MNYLKFLPLFFVLTSLSFVSCKKEIALQKNILWVNKERVPCTGVADQICYLVQESGELGMDWNLFYDSIHGFDSQYEEGFIYKLEVLIETVENPPADASSLKYTLVEIISKE